MTLSTATAVCTALAGIGLLAKALDLWLGTEKKVRLQNLVKAFHARYSSSDPRDATFFPVFLLGAVYDRLFGKRIISSHAFYRSLWLMVGLLVVALSVEGLVTGVHFGIKTPPWGFASTSSEIFNESAKKLATDPKFANYAYSSFVVGVYGACGRFLNNGFGKLLYTCFFILAVAVLNGLLSFTSVVISRMFLKEILEYKGGVRSLVFLFMLDGFFLASASSVILLLLGLLAIPAIWISIVPLFLASLATPRVFISLLSSGITISWEVCATWLKVAASVAFIPTILILIPFVIGSTGRRYLKLFVIWFIERGLEFDGGFLAYLVVALGIIGSLIGYLVGSL